MEKIREFFRQFGLEENEEKVFFALLELGQSGVVNIAKKTGFKRSTTYYLLDQLINKGLVTLLQKGAHRIYSSVPPETIQKLLEKKEEQIENEKEKFTKLMPELALLYGRLPDRPKVIYYEGQAGLRTVYEDMILPKTEEILYIGEVGSLEKILGKTFLKRHVQKRIARHIKTRAVRVKETEVDEELYQPGKKYLRDIKYAPDWFKAPTGVFIYRNRVSLVSTTKEGFGVIIESQDYHETMKNWFEFLWKKL